MWAKKEVAGRQSLYTWNAVREAQEGNVRISRATLNPPLQSPRFHVNPYTGIELEPVPAKLVADLEGSLTYRLVLSLHDDLQIEGLASAIRERARELIPGVGERLIALEKYGGSKEDSRRDELEAHLQRLRDVPAQVEDIISRYSAQGYLEIACQRGWNNSGKSREVEANAPLMASEKDLLRPSVRLLASSLGELDKPFRQGDYYRGILERF